MTESRTPPADDGIDRRGFLRCMAWAGTGVAWAVNGGVLTSRLLGQASSPDEGDFTFVQLSDSHIGFARPANPDVKGTLKRAVEKINALAQPPAFVLHTGDLTHLSKPGEFDDVAEILKGAQAERICYVPGEH